MGWFGLYVSVACVFSQAAGILLSIEPHKIQYIGERDVTIRCALGESDIETIGWMQISKQNLLMRKTPFLILRISDGMGPEWGSKVDDAKMDGKSSVKYSLEPIEETFLEVTLHQIECGDDGIYSCEVFGLNKNESMAEDTVREELIVYSYGEQPVIMYYSAKIPSKKVTVTPGSEVSLLCNGMVGKPHLPITWYQYSNQVGAFVSLEEGVSEETMMVGKDNMCSYNGSRFLTFTAPQEEQEITLSCGIGPLYDRITIVTGNTTTESFDMMFKKRKAAHQTNANTEEGRDDGILLSINPSKVQYQGDVDVTIRCSVGNLADNLTRLGFIEIQKESPVALKRPFLTLKATNGTDPEWGSGIDSRNVERKSTVTYQRHPLNETVLQVVLHRMECDDEGVYTCTLFGADDDNNLIQKTVREELSIYTYAGEPVITINDQTFPTKEVHAQVGSNITLTCEGPVGKPLVPIQWYKYDMYAGAYVYTTDGIQPESVDLPIDHLCRYTGTSTLTFVTTVLEPEVTYECKIGAFADSITVTIDGRTNDIPPSYSRETQPRETEEINSAESRVGSCILCAVLAVMAWINSTS